MTTPSRPMMLFVFCLAACSGSAFAQETDRMHSAACHDALAALQAQEGTTETDEEAASHAAPRRSAAHEALRRRAAQTCLGGRPDAPRESPQSVVPPISIPPVRYGLPAPAKTAPTTPSTSPAIRPGMPTVLTHCDSNGCWASDGTRLNRVGPALLGPRGVCNINGTAVQCP